MCYFVKLCVVVLSIPCICGITKSTMVSLHTSPLTWNEAYENCKRQGRSLLQINHRGKQLVLQDIIAKWKTENLLSTTLWIGGLYYTGTDSKVNGYYWSDCTAMVNYTNWVSSLTQDTTGKCVYGILEDFSWSNTLCIQQLPYISELGTGNCYFEQRGDQKLSEPDLVDLSPATETDCMTKCLDYSLNGNDCQAFSGNGSVCLIMETPYIHLNSFVPSVTYNAPGVRTFLKRCYTTGIDEITPTFFPPITLSTEPKTTCSPTDPYPTQPYIGTSEETTIIQSTISTNPSTSENNIIYTSQIITNKNDTTTASYITPDILGVTDTTTNIARSSTTSSTMNQNTTSTTNHDIISTAKQDSTSTDNQVINSTINQNTTRSTHQNTTSTTYQDITRSTIQDNDSTSNQDSASTINPDTTITLNKDTTSTMNQDTTSTTIQYTTVTTNQTIQDTTSTTDPVDTITAMQDIDSTTIQDNDSTSNKDSTSTINSDTITMNQDITSSTNQYTDVTSSQTIQDTNSTTDLVDTITAIQNINSTTNQDSTGTMDPTTTMNQDTTNATNQYTAVTKNQETESPTITEARAMTKYTTQELNFITIWEGMPGNNKTTILYASESDCFVSNISEPGIDSQVLLGHFKCICKKNGNSSLIDAQYQFLLINRLQLSSNRRKLTSAPDKRTSAICLGSIGISFLVLTFSVFVFSDLVNFLRKNS